MKHTDVINEYGKATWEAQRHYITTDLDFTGEMLTKAAATVGVTVEQFKLDTEARQREFIPWDQLPKAAQQLWVLFITSDSIIDAQLVATREICEAAKVYQAQTS